MTPNKCGIFKDCIEEIYFEDKDFIVMLSKGYYKGKFGAVFDYCTYVGGCAVGLSIDHVIYDSEEQCMKVIRKGLKEDLTRFADEHTEYKRSVELMFKCKSQPELF